MRSCDVLIVGAGPAGSSCAWGLRSSGLDVVLLDKSTFPRDKVCGGWITPFVLQELQIDAREYAPGRTLQPICAFRVSCLGEADTVIMYKQPVSYGIRRREFDEYLVRRCGADVRENVTVKSIERAAGAWIINGEFKTRLLIGAGGHFCPVARMTPGREHEQAVIAQEIEFCMTDHEAENCRVSPEAPELYFCRDLKGYGWCFRKENFLNIGLGRLDQHRLSEHVSNFAQFLRRRDRVGFDLGRRFAGHAYLLYGYSPRKIVDDGLMLIGDSAGLAYAQSGEGIRPAVESGLIAAEVVLAADSNFSAERLSHYPALLRQRFGKQSGAGESLAKRLPTGFRNAIARMLLKNEKFCRSVVVENWFLRMNDAPLSSYSPAIPRASDRVAV
jgi:geranylgeranyl reductase family protein